MANPTNQDPDFRRFVNRLFGFDRDSCIENNVCVPRPIGCGGPATEFRDDESLKEYEMSGFCQSCQDAFFGKFPHLKNTKTIDEYEDAMTDEDHTSMMEAAEWLSMLSTNEDEEQSDV